MHIQMSPQTTWLKIIIKYTTVKRLDEITLEFKLTQHLTNVFPGS